MNKTNSCKIWVWVDSGSFPEWWRISANLSLRSCVLTQPRYITDRYFSFVITRDMMLIPILSFIFYLIIVEHMPHLLASNNEGLHLPKCNNKIVQKTATKQLLSSYSITKTPNVNHFLSFGLLIVDVHNHKSKHMTKNKDSPITTTNTN